MKKRNWLEEKNHRKNNNNYSASELDSEYKSDESEPNLDPESVQSESEGSSTGVAERGISGSFKRDRILALRERTGGLGKSLAK